MIDISVRENINIRDKQVTVIGLGLSGIETAKLANHLGARVFASDSGSSKRVSAHAMDLMHSHHIASETGLHSEKIYDADLWVLSPGVPKNADIVIKAQEKYIPIVGEIEFSSWFTESPIVAVTGSNGKTTTAYILAEMCQSKNNHAVMAGNMGLPFSERVLNEIKTLDETRMYILEVSSFQMEFVYHFSPTIAVYTNLSIDHLDRHGSMEEYLKMKLRMIQNMDQESCVVYNGDDAALVSAVENQNVRMQPFSTTRSNTLYTWEGTSIKNHSGKSLAGLDELGILGDHNLSNLLSAATCSHLLGIPDDHISQVMKTFTGVEHRLEHVLTINDVQYINDSKATNINSVIVAIDTFKKPIILILGGRNKGADFRLLLPHIKSSHVRDVISYGEAGGQIDAALGDAVRSVQVTDLNSAVKKAQVLAAPGDIVLLSPGCASFDEFSNFEVRGKFFKSAVMEIKAA